MGGVAQLGEHLLCKQGVVGSSPITSISSGAKRALRECFWMGLIVSSQWKSEFRCYACLHSRREAIGIAPVVSVRATGRVVFVNVNQVLVRLWARCQGVSDPHRLSSKPQV